MRKREYQKLFSETKAYGPNAFTFLLLCAKYNIKGF